MSLVSGENLPMIHSTRSIGIESIRYPITTIQTKRNRIIISALILSGRVTVMTRPLYICKYDSSCDDIGQLL